MNTANPNNVTPAFAAEYLGVNVRTLSNWRSTKRYHLPYIKIGQVIRYRMVDLDDFLAKRTIGGEEK